MKSKSNIDSKNTITNKLPRDKKNVNVAFKYAYLKRRNIPI